MKALFYAGLSVVQKVRSVSGLLSLIWQILSAAFGKLGSVPV